MTRIVHRLTLIIVLTGTAGYAADTVSIAEPVYRLTPREAPSPSTVHAQWSGRLDAVSWWINLWGQEAVNKKVSAAIEAKIEKQKELLEWSDGGVLLNIRVIRATTTDSKLKPMGVFGDGALVIGAGRSPEEVLVNHWSKSTLDAAIPEGWVLDEVMSPYVWVTSVNGKMVRRIVASGTMLELHKRVQDNFPLLFREMIESRFENQKTWVRAIELAKRRTAERAAKAALDKSLMTVLESQKRVSEINKQLKEALDREKKSAEGVTILRTLQGILSVSQLIGQAVEILDVNPQSFQNTKSAAAVITKSEEINGERHQYSVRLMADFNGSAEDLNKWLSVLWTAIQPAKPPSALKEHFHVDIKPPLP